MSDTVRCPRRECNHPINDHTTHGCTTNAICGCQVDPNTIALAAVQTALFGDLTPTPGPQHVVRRPDGSWA